MISQQTIQQILSRIDIIEIVGEFVKLKKRGANYLGLCPFHNEKTPSFTVSPSKEIYKCFGCGRSGNTISFLMEHEKYSYVETLRWLANKYNVEIEETESSPELKLQQYAADSLHSLNTFAQKYFSSKLFESEEGQNIALSYLKERGFREEIIKKFQLGYCLLERDTFAKTALTAQYNIEYLVKSGLVVVKDDKPVDNYRGRIIFPVHNQTGKVIGFGARIIAKNDKAPKYINTPENELYIKSKILYGSYFARQSIDKQNECLLVEGYTDVISLHQAGIENVVASGGTSLTQDQLRLIKKYTKNLTIIYDGDSAGIKAALRGLDMALEEGLNVKLVLIPDNEDPDSYVNKIGSIKFNEFIQTNKKDFILFQVDIALREAGNDITKKSEVVNSIAETLSNFNNPINRSKLEDYIKLVSSILKITEEGLFYLVQKHTKEKLLKNGKLPSVDEKKVFQESASKPTEEPLNETIDLLLESNYQEREIVKRLVEFGSLKWDEKLKVFDIIFDTIKEYPLNNIKLIQIVEQYKNLLEEYEGIVEPKSLLYNATDEETSKFIAGLLFFPYELANWERIVGNKFKKIDADIHESIESALSFYQIRKIKVLFAEVESQIEKQQDYQEKILDIQVYSRLKEIEMSITKKLGTVIVK